MCGRFVGYRTVEELQRHFAVHESCCEAAANYNVAPSQEILAIVRRQGRNVLEKFHWGLVPSWSKDLSIGDRMINARAETLSQKPSFRTAFKKRRCLIPADGFYEWKKDRGGRRPYFFTLPDEGPFAFAGLWDTWHGPEAEAAYASCAVVTTAASPSVRSIHHSMPAILMPQKYDEWLDTQNQDTGRLQDILSGWLLRDLRFRPVSPRVNSVRNNDPDNIRSLVQSELEF